MTKGSVYRSNLYVLVAILLITSLAAHADYYVDDDYGNPAPGTGTPTDPFHLLQDAVDDTPQGATIQVAPGTYDGFLIHTEAIYDDKTILGAGPELSIINGNNSNRCIDVFGGDNLTISGFSIINGKGLKGAGIKVRYSNNIDIIDCNILSNKAVVYSSLFGGNTDVAYGAGAYVFDSSVNFHNTIFKNNHCVRYAFMSGSSRNGSGGAIMDVNSTVNIYSSIITGNSATYGGAIASDYDADVYASNTIIYGNTASLYNNIYTQGTFAPTYCDIEGGWTGEGNIDQNPQFVNSAAMDYHLKIDSLCIDAGDNSTVSTIYDIDRQPRIMDGRNDGYPVVDMGLDEFLYVHPNDLYVDKDWSGTTLYTPIEGHIFGYDAFSSIGAALNASQYGNNIFIAPDYYRGPITLVDGVLLKGEDVYNTFIDGIRGVHCIEADKCGPDTIIENLTLIDGYSATNGGAAYINESRLKFFNCRILHSSTDGNGGGVYAYKSACQFVNCVLNENLATDGAGFALIDDQGSQIINCTLVENDATHHGGGFYSNSSIATEITNSIFWLNDVTQIEYTGSAPTVTYCDIYHQTISGTGNFDIDPNFIDPANRNFNLNTDSDCIDRGNNAAVPAWVSIDIDGDVRIIDGDYDLTPTVDVGVDEVPIPTEVWVSEDWLGLSYGDPIPKQSWTFGITAFATISDGLTGVNAPGTVNVLQGTYVETIYLRSDVNLIAQEGPERTIISAPEHARCIQGINISQDTLIQGFKIKDGMFDIGGAVHLTNSDCNFVHCIFTQNNADLGGAMYLNNSSPSIINCLFHGNEAGQSACIHNAAASSPLIVNSTFAGNSTNNDPEIMGSSGSSAPTVINSILWSNSPLPVYDDATSLSHITYSDIKNGWKDEGNFGSDPLFVNPSHDDFHIQPTSYCIDAGDDANVFTDYDCDGDTRQLQGYSTGTPRVDIGYDEQIYQALDTIWVDEYFSSFPTGSHVAGRVIGYDAYGTITEAIDNIVYPGTIYVNDGTYYENITMQNNLTIIGNDPNTTIINGNANGPVVTAQNLDETAQIQGFKITNGSGKYSNGDYYGGGFYMLNANIIISDCIIKDNCADTGRSMYIIASTPIITNCRFSNQGYSSHCDGYAIYSSGSHPIFIQDAFHDNQTGVAAIKYGSAKFYNCIAYGNGINGYNCTVNLSNGSDLEIYNSIFYNSVHTEIFAASDCTYLFNYSLIDGVYTIGGGTPTGTIDGCFYENPRFIDGTNGDFHLQYNSPCIEAGDSNFVPTGLTEDFFGGDRLIDADCNGDPNVDMGIHEFTWLPYGSVDGDCKIDFKDVATVAKRWLLKSGDINYNENYDPTQDGKIDFDDIAIIANYWLIGTP